MDSKPLITFLWRIFFCLSLLSLISTKQSAINTTLLNEIEPKIEEKNSTNDRTIIDLNSGKSHEIQISNEITETKINDSLISERTTKLPSNELEITDGIIGTNSPVDQLTELSADQINRPSIEVNLFERNQTTIIPLITDLENRSLRTDTSIESSGQQNISNNNQTNDSSNSVLLKNDKNVSTPTLPLTTSSSAKLQKRDQMSASESHRNKRSFFRNSLHSNLDELLNMKRQRRATMRSKRNTNYEDLLASLLTQEEPKSNDIYDSYADKNELNALLMNYILSTLSSDDSNKNLDKLNQYYYENLLPLIDSTYVGSDSVSDEENVEQELPIIVQPYSQSVVPFSLPNRYQRIRRSYFDRYPNPISVYTGLKKKRGPIRGEWGHIVGRNNERSSYDDEAQEANKIYSLATLLATGSSPQEQRLRFKRSDNRSVKPIITLKNM